MKPDVEMKKLGKSSNANLEKKEEKALENEIQELGAEDEV